jgi:hypothetical protein
MVYVPVEEMVKSTSFEILEVKVKPWLKSILSLKFFWKLTIPGVLLKAMLVFRLNWDLILAIGVPYVINNLDLNWPDRFSGLVNCPPDLKSVSPLIKVSVCATKVLFPMKSSVSDRNKKVKKVLDFSRLIFE